MSNHTPMEMAARPSEVSSPTISQQPPQNRSSHFNTSSEAAHRSIDVDPQDEVSGTPLLTTNPVMGQSATQVLRQRREADSSAAVTPGNDPFDDITQASPEGATMEEIGLSPMNDSVATMGSFGNATLFPQEVVRIARQVRGLDAKNLLMLTELTQHRAWRDCYSVMAYRGTSWYLPAFRPLKDDEPGCGVGFERTAGLWIAMFGWRLEINLVGHLIRFAVLTALWLALWANFPDHYFELRGAVFDPAVAVLFSAIVGGIISRVFRIPSLVCVLWAAILWHNVPSVGYFTSGISKPIRSAGTTFGLTVILIRAGLYIKPEEIKPILGSFAAFALLPGIAELVTHSMVAKSIFEYPDYTWAFSHGAIAAVVSPAVVVPAMLNLKMEGFCLTRGPGMLMMPASPAEMVAGIWNVNFMAQLTIDTGDKPLWLNILLGPLQIIGGLVLGVILGCVHFLILKALLAEAKKLPHRAYTAEHMNNVALLSSISMVVFGAACLAYTKELSLSGGGAVAVTVMAMVSGALHRRRYDTPYFAEQFKYLSTNTAELWDTITMPVLFTMVGTGINLGDVFTAEFFPKILACLVCGLVARMALTIAVTAPQDYDVGERVVMAIGWCGKASVQAALGRVVLDRAVKNFDTFVAKDGLAIAQRNVDLAKQITNSAIVMILVCAPIAALTLVRIGPYVFRNEKKAASPAK